MSWFDRLFGRDDVLDDPSIPVQHRTADRSDGDVAVERYRYLLRTAPPETIEQVHIEAFAKLTPRQRDLLFQQLSANAPPGDRPIGDDPEALAQSATRSELRRPGTMERTLRGANGALGFGGTFASSMLGAVAGYVIGSSLMSTFLPADSGSLDAGADASGDPDAGSDQFESGFGDFGGFDF